MHNQPNDAAGPQELDMTQSFEISEDGKVRIAGAVVRDNAPVN